jgi:hypothetical protein
VNHSEFVSFLWGVADLIRDTFKRGKYQDVILPLTVLRRLDCVLAPTKDKVLQTQARLKGRMENLEAQLCKATGLAFLQHLAVRLRQAPGRRPAPGRQPAQLHRRLQPEHSRGAADRFPQPRGLPMARRLLALPMNRGPQPIPPTMISASFDSTKTSLHDLLVRADQGRLQLPDFQRGWVWDDERIRSLLASVSVSFPIGAVMLLQSGGDHVRFKPRPLAGTHPRLREVAPETLILDGQQRLTSLYQALMSTAAVETKDAKSQPIRRWYYLDMKKAVANDNDREDAVLSIPEDRRLKAFGGEIVLDVTTPEREYAADLFPVNQVFRSADWR